MTLEMVPIGVVRSTRTLVVDDGWDEVSVHVELDPRFGPEALVGLDTFSHVEVLFFMDRVDPDKVERGARHPRNDPRLPKVGIFAQRGKNRPNRIGTTVCRVDRVDGMSLYVSGLDAVDGTPVLDLKPWVRELGPRGEVRQPGWMDDMMKGYWST
jgi:tRNA-Thr(GGU) m(6)t(6)A37 methyltransferase TsaA